MSMTRGRVLTGLFNTFVVAFSLFWLRLSWILLDQIDHFQIPFTVKDVAGLTFFLMFAGFWIPIAWVMMTYATPRALIDRYFKEPQFTVAETVGRNLISPLMTFHTSLFMAACTLPRSWLASRWLRRRQMTDLRDHAPRWFVWCSRVIYTGAFVHFVLVMGLLIGLVTFATFFDS